MRENCRENLLRRLREIKQLPVHEKCTDTVLILDDMTSKLLTSIISLNNILDFGIKFLTKASLKKKPQPFSLAIYYISNQSIPCIFKDFKNDPIYFSINILLCEYATPELMKDLAADKKVLERIASFGELYMGIRYPSKNVALICEQNNLLRSVIARDSSGVVAVSFKLLQALICSYGDNIDLIIHYQENFEYCKRLSMCLLEQNNSHKSTQSGNQNESSRDLLNQNDRTAVKVNLLIIDRNFDLISPAIRSFHYYPMVCDIFKTNYKTTNVKLKEAEIKIDLDDPIFLKYKNMHLAKALDAIRVDLSQFKEDNQAAKMQKAGNEKEIQLKLVIRELPEYNRSIKSFNDQMSIMKELSLFSKERNLTEIGDFEHLAVSGHNVNGEPEKDKKIMQKAMQLHSRIKNTEQMLRFLFITLTCIEASESDVKSLISKIKVVRGSEKLGHLLEKSLPITNRNRMKRIKQRQNLFLNRHECVLAGALEQLLETKSSKVLRTIQQQPQSTKQRFDRLGKSTKNKRTQIEWAVCAIGGLGVNQITQIQQVGSRQKLQRVGIITDNVFGPQEYLQKLGSSL